MKKIKIILLNFFSLLAHLFAAFVIYYFWQPIINWYWSYRPVLGVDFYNMASYVAYLARHFVLRFNGWKYIWHGGYPMEFDYPTLHAYLNLPLLTIFSLPQAVQAYMLFACFLFLFFSYLLFWELGKDRVLAVILAIASAFSIGPYGPLVWGGSLPYFATQFFLPLVLWSLIKFLNTTDKRWFFLSSLFLGISFFGHPQVAFSYMIPTSILLLLFYPFTNEKFFTAARFKRIFAFLITAVIIGFPQLTLQLGRTPLQMLTAIPSSIDTLLRLIIGRNKVLTGGASPSDITTVTDTAADIAQFQKNQLGHFISETNSLFFTFLAAALVIFFLSIIIRKKRKKSFKAIVFAMPALWIVFYNFLFAYGINFFHGGWYRVFWPFPLALGVLISFIWGDLSASIRERLEFIEKKFILRIILLFFFGLSVFFPGYFLLKQYSAQKMLAEIELPRLRQQSSAFPDSLNVYINKQEFEQLSKKLTPSWLDPNNTQYRLYENDQRVNIWWSALFDMPLVKGYIDDPSGDSAGGFYWTSIALSQSAGQDTLVKTWGAPEDIAYNNALFLIDWFSIKYLEAEHEKSDSYNPLSSYLAKSDIFDKKEKVIIPGYAQLYAHKPDETGPIVWHPQEEEYLTYYEVKDSLVSPIAHTSNTSVVGVIGAVDAYRTILRDLAAVNLNSKRVIPLQLGQFIDDIAYDTLKNMDMVILYAYDYKNHRGVWNKIEKYVKEGGKVFIETGSEVKQTDSINLPVNYPKELPAIFPIRATKKAQLGTEWRPSSDAKEAEGINLNAFGPPILDENPWLFSVPNADNDLREGAKVILSNKGTPLIVSWRYGEGQVVWSGMNLPYHITTHKSLEEAKFFKNLLEDFISTTPVDYSGYNIERKSASKIVISGKGVKGVFFREQGYSGWNAKVNGKGLKIYRSGPTYPGFMYVIVPKELRDSEFKVIFSYQSDFWSYFWPTISLLTIIILLDIIVFNSRLVVPVLRRVSSTVSKRVGGWWEKEEEY